MNAELVINLLQVAVHGPQADPQGFSDLFVQAAVAQQIQDIALALRQPGHIAPGFESGKRLDQALKVPSNMEGDTIRRENTVFQYTNDWLEQALRWRALQEIAGGATGGGFEELITVFVSREENDREAAGQPLRQKRKISGDHLRRTGIDQRQIRRTSREVAESVVRAGIRRCACETRLAIEAPDQGSPDAGIRFHDGHLDVLAGVR